VGYDRDRIRASSTTAWPFPAWTSPASTTRSAFAPRLSFAHTGVALDPTCSAQTGRDDWFPTGDAGAVDGQRVSVKGRLGFVIIPAARNSGPKARSRARHARRRARRRGHGRRGRRVGPARRRSCVVSDGTEFDERIRGVVRKNESDRRRQATRSIRYVAGNFLARPTARSQRKRRSESPLGRSVRGPR